MPATVIDGLFSSVGITWANTVAGGANYDGFFCVPNTTNQTQTLTGASIAGGTAPGDFIIPGGQFPVTFNPGQTVLVHVFFTPGGAGSRTSFINITSLTTFAPSGFLNGSQNGPGGGQPFPSDITFPNTKLGTATNFANAQIVNVANAQITVSSIAFATGTDFFLINPPITPFNIPAGGKSAVFTIRFIPTAVGARNDTLNVVTTTPGFTLIAVVSGTGTVLQSAFTLAGTSQDTLFAFPGSGTGPVVLRASPLDLNCEESGSFLRMHDLGQIDQEKQVLRVRGHYEDLGVATITITATSRRLGKPDQVSVKNVSIGSAAADGWVREFLAEVNITGELVQLKVSRAANSGPVSIIDYIPEFVSKGEVIGGT